MSLPTDNQSSTSATPDSYDAHIIPAETAARKDREGENYKKTPENTEGKDSIDTTGGYTVDQEGLANNYATEPEMYYETPGDAQEDSKGGASTDLVGDECTIVDTFVSAEEAGKAVLKLKESGLDAHKISVLGIEQSEGLASLLVGRGIASQDAVKYEAETKAGKSVVLVTGSDKEITQANQVLHMMGHETREEATL